MKATLNSMSYVATKENIQLILMVKHLCSLMKWQREYLLELFKNFKITCDYSGIDFDADEIRN